MAGSFFSHCVGFFSDEEMDEDVWKTQPHKMRDSQAKTSPRVSPDSPPGSNQPLDLPSDRSRTPVLVLSSGEEDEAPGTAGSGEEAKETFSADLPTTTSKIKSEPNVCKTSDDASEEKPSSEFAEVENDPTQASDDLSCQFGEVQATRELSGTDFLLLEEEKFESLGFAYTRCESLGFDVSKVEPAKGQDGEVVDPGQRADRPGWKEADQDEAKMMSDDEFIMSKEELEDNEKHELERGSSEYESGAEKSDSEQDEDSTIKPEPAPNPDSRASFASSTTVPDEKAEKSSAPGKEKDTVTTAEVTKQSATSAEPGTAPSASVQKALPATLPKSACHSPGTQPSRVSHGQKAGSAPSNQPPVQPEPASKGDKQEADGKSDKGDKSDTKQEKAKKRAGTASVLTGSESTTSESGSAPANERPESCSVS